MKPFTLGIAALLGLALTCPNARPQTPLKLVELTDGFSSPVAICSQPNDPDRLFVVEQGGKIKILLLDTNEIRSPAFLNIEEDVLSGGEQGLLGMAFHPDVENNGFFYINYTNNSGDTVIERYEINPNNEMRADKDSGIIILGPVDQPFTNHNAGQLAFGADGFLYIGFGDGGSANDPSCNAQTPDTFLGKMLRIDVDVPVGYDIPADNPWVDDPTILDEIWAFGLRNPWRYTFDRLTGDLYIADVGQNSLEEVNFTPVDSGGGHNYGWKIMEGTSCFGTSNCPAGIPACNDPELTDPIHTYSHGVNCSITGGYVYRGCAIPDLDGTYFFADFCSSNIWSFRFDGNNLTDFTDRTAELSGATSISSFGEDSCGELYMTSLNGEVFRIEADVTPQSTDLGFGKIGSNGLEPVLDLCGLTDSGNSALLRLRDAPPNAFSLLFIADEINETPVRGGTLAATPPLLLLVLATNSEGKFEGVIEGGLGPATLFFQFLLQDVGATFDTGFSNALEVELLP